MKNEKLQNILFKDNIEKKELSYLLNLEEPSELSLLFKRADQIRRDYCGDDVHFRGAIEISNYCKQNCLYCGLRDDNYSIERYRMEPDEIIDVASKISKLGIFTIVLKSGEDVQLDTDIIAYLIYSIKNSTNVAITLSLGERGFDEYKTWKIAGADRYILRHETCNIEKHSFLKNKKAFIDRVKHLQYLKRLGYQIGTGNLIGMPFQTTTEIVDDIFLMKELNVDIASFAPFIPSPNTPFQTKDVGSIDLTLKAIAAARLVLKNVHIPATLSLDTVDETGREKGLNSGANFVIPDFTPTPYREKYQVYPNRRDVDVDPIETHKSLKKRIERLGRTISFSRGDSLKNAASITL